MHIFNCSAFPFFCIHQYILYLAVYQKLPFFFLQAGGTGDEFLDELLSSQDAVVSGMGALLRQSIVNFFLGILSNETGQARISARR